ncbi:MAG TPA: DUF5667 domain-containing protein [Pseudonocardiaceae bacterium]
MRNRQRERFARAADALAGHGKQRDRVEPHDPRLAGQIAVLLRLSRSGDATAPQPDARERMRAKVLAELPEILTEHAKTARSTTLSTTAKPTRRGAGTKGRLAIAVGAAFCLVVALCGMTMLLSNSALPGDPLYGVRRTVESAAMSLTFGDESKGLKHLGYAADRISDIETLAAHYPNTADSPAGDYLTAFADFASDAAAGSTDLTGYASSNGPDVLNQLHDWAGQQSARITSVDAKLPAEAKTAATTSQTLLSRIETRATALLARTTCYTVTSGTSDDIGVLPATGPCDHAPGVDTATQPIAPDLTHSQTPPADVATQPHTDQAPTTTQPQVPPPAHPATSTAPPPPVTSPTQPSVPTTPVLPVPPTITLPLPLPGLRIPPLLPGLPGIGVGA